MFNAKVKKIRNAVLTVATLFVLMLAALTSVRAVVPVPRDYQLLYPNMLTGNYKGVRVYTKVSGNTKDFVTVVDLNYATLRNFVGDYGSGPLKATLLKPRTLEGFWVSAVAQNSYPRRATAAFNGTFFAENRNGDPVPIAFGLKQDGWRISDGYGLGEFPGLIRTFAFDSSYGSSSIQPYKIDTFNGGTPNVVGGLEPTANKDGRIKDPIARTFVGVRNDYGDSRSETIIFFSSNAAPQKRAVEVLDSFGAGSKMMLDGGGSTGFILNGDPKIFSSRPIPQAFIVYEGR